jgi:hypothetical protein
MSEEKTNNKDWVPEDLRDNPTLQKFTEPGALAKSYVEMSALLGSKTSYPKADAGDEDWDKFYKPLVPEQYELKFEDLKSIGSKDIVNDGFIENAKKLGLTNRQAQGLLDTFRSTLESKETEVLGAREAATKAQVAALDAKFGDNLEKVHGIVDEYVSRNYGKEVLELFKNSVYNDASALDSLFKKAKATAQDSGLPDNASGGRGEARTQLQGEFESFLHGTHSKYKGALLNNRDAAHIEAQKRFAELQRALQLYD